MDKLMQLERRRNKLRPYHVSMIIIAVVMTFFIYMIAAIAKVENAKEFQSYANLLKMHTAISFIIYSVFAVILLSKLVLEDYSPQRAILLFTYPVSRSKVFVAKLMMVLRFVTVGFLMASALPTGVFLITEQVAPILGEVVRADLLLLQAVRLMGFLAAIIANGLIALRVGLSKGATSAMVTILILSVLMGNLLLGIGMHPMVSIGLLVYIAVGIWFAILANRKIEKMEV